jgi:hypothetical protein
MNDIRNINYGTQKIEEYFSSFLTSDFRLIKSSVDHKGFGSWVAVLQSKQCLIKFVQDRGSISVLIGPLWASDEPFDLEHFFDLNLLIDFNNKSQSIISPSKYDAYDIDKRLHDLNIALKEYFHNLIPLFSLSREDFLKVEKEVENYNLQKLRRIYPNIK